MPFVGMGVLGCGGPLQSEDNPRELSKCESLVQSDDLIELTGTLVINAENDLVFKSTSDDSLGIACPTFLIECGEGLNDYVENAYTFYSNIRNIDEEFWVTITGKYMNLEHYKNQDDSFKRLEFVYTFVALGPETKE